MASLISPADLSQQHCVPRLLQFLTLQPWPCSRFGRRFCQRCARACPRNKASGLLMRRITGSNLVRCAPTADRLGHASRPGGLAALNLNGRRSCVRRRAAFRPPIQTAGPTRQAQIQRRRRLTEGRSAQRLRSPELARHRRDAVTCSGPVVVDDFPHEIPITQRELDVIETYLGALLDDALGVPE